MEALIVEPLSSSGVSAVIIIDALDECGDEDLQSAILSVMADWSKGFRKSNSSSPVVQSSP